MAAHAVCSASIAAGLSRCCIEPVLLLATLAAQNVCYHSKCLLSLIMSARGHLRLQQLQGVLQDAAGASGADAEVQ